MSKTYKTFYSVHISRNTVNANSTSMQILFSSSFKVNSGLNPLPRSLGMKTQVIMVQDDQSNMAVFFWYIVKVTLV